MEKAHLHEKDQHTAEIEGVSLALGLIAKKGIACRRKNSIDERTFFVMK